MFDWLKRLYGEGTVKVGFTTLSGIKGTAKMSYIGEYDELEIRQQVTEQIESKYNCVVATTKIIEHEEK